MTRDRIAEFLGRKAPFEPLSRFLGESPPKSLIIIAVRRSLSFTLLCRQQSLGVPLESLMHMVKLKIEYSTAPRIKNQNETIELWLLNNFFLYSLSNDSYQIYIKTSPFFVRSKLYRFIQIFLIQIHRHELLMKAFLPPTGFNVKSNYECMIIIKYRYATSYLLCIQLDSTFN